MHKSVHVLIVLRKQASCCPKEPCGWSSRWTELRGLCHSRIEVVVYVKCTVPQSIPAVGLHRLYKLGKFPSFGSHFPPLRPRLSNVFAR